MRAIISAITVAVIVGSVLVVSPASATPVDCATYMLLGGRGTTAEPKPATIAQLGEEAAYAANDDGIGEMATAILDLLQPALEAQGGTLKVHGARYPATGDYPMVGKFIPGQHVMWDDNVAIGATDLINTMATENAACPGTKFLMVGYSQGAQVVAGAIEGSSPAVNSQIAATAIFGDPQFEPGDAAANRGSYRTDRFGMWGHRGLWSDKVDSPVFSYCNKGDVACQLNQTDGWVLPGGQDQISIRDWVSILEYSEEHFNGDPMGQHSNYPKNGSATLAAKAMAGALNISLLENQDPAVDVVYVLDSTAEMSWPISELQERASEITAGVEAITSNARYAVVDYKGNPRDDDPGVGNDYVSRITQDFSSSPSDISSALETITASGGTPVPWWYAPQAAGYSGLLTSATLSWRPHARKIVLLVSGNRVGDADPHGTESGTSITAATVSAALKTQSDLEIHAMAWTGQLYGGLWESDVVTDAGRGAFEMLSTNTSVVDTTVEMLDDAVRTPNVELSGPEFALTGSYQYSASGSKSVVPDTDIAYVWDVCVIDPNAGTASRTTSRDENDPDPDPEDPNDPNDPNDNIYPFCNQFGPMDPISVPAIDESSLLTVDFEQAGNYVVTVRGASDPTSEQHWDGESIYVSVLDLENIAPPTPAPSPSKGFENGDLRLGVEADSSQSARGKYWALSDPEGNVVEWFTMPEGSFDYVVENAQEKGDLGWTLSNGEYPVDFEPQVSPAATTASYEHLTSSIDGDAGGVLTLEGAMTPELTAIRDANADGDPASVLGDYTATLTGADGTTIGYYMADADARIALGETTWTVSFTWGDSFDSNGTPMWELFKYGFADRLFQAGLIELQIDGESVTLRINGDTDATQINLGVLDPNASPPDGVDVDIDPTQSTAERIELSHDGAYDSALFPALDGIDNPDGFDWENAWTSDYRVYVENAEYEMSGYITVYAVEAPAETGDDTIRLAFEGTVGDGSDATMSDFLQHGTISFSVEGGDVNTVELSATESEADAILSIE